MSHNKIPERVIERKWIVAHTVTGPVLIPLWGIARVDDLLRQWAARGGAAVREHTVNATSQAA